MKKWQIWLIVACTVLACYGSIEADWSKCGRCQNPWYLVKAHTTECPGRSWGMFPLCEECWQKLTPQQRLPYYEEVWREWHDRWGDVRGVSEWDSLKAAVLRGK